MTIETEAQLQDWFYGLKVDPKATELSFKAWEDCLNSWSVGKCYAFAMLSVGWLDSAGIGWGALRAVDSGRLDA